MGRILKKKDPVKKKALRDERNSREEQVAPNDTTGQFDKPSNVQKSTINQVSTKTSFLNHSLIQKALQFLREVKIELKKVVWPSRKQTIGSTAVVLVLVMIISIFLGVVDFGLSNLIRVVLP